MATQGRDAQRQDGAQRLRAHPGRDRSGDPGRQAPHYRCNSIHGNPFLRLLRREVEALVKKKHGGDYLREQQAKTEVARIDRELKRLKAQIAALQEQKSKLMNDPRG